MRSLIPTIQRTEEEIPVIDPSAISSTSPLLEGHEAARKRKRRIAVVVLSVLFVIFVVVVIVSFAIRHSSSSSSTSPVPPRCNGAADIANLVGLTSGLTQASRDASWTTSTPPCHWKGVQCVDGKVTGLLWQSLLLSGTMDLTQVPCGVEVLNLADNDNLFCTLNVSFLPSQLSTLNLRGTPTSGAIDFGAFVYMTHLQVLNLAGTGLVGAVLPTHRFPPSLIYLDLSNMESLTSFSWTSLTGVKLQHLDLSHNNMGTTLPWEALTPLASSLQYLNLAFNHWQGTLNISAVSLVPTLYLHDNDFIDVIWPDRGVASSSIGDINVANNQLAGVLNVSDLPQSATRINLAGNYWTGTVAWSEFPMGLTSVDLSRNMLSGTVAWSDFAKAAPRLETLSIGWNTFSGSLDASALPRSMTSFDASGNWFLGTIAWNALPSNLTKFMMSNNNFTGSVECSQFPPSLGIVWIANNRFEGSLPLGSAPQALQDFDGHNNRFTGLPDLTNVTISRINLGENMFCGSTSLSPATTSWCRGAQFYHMCNASVTPNVTCSQNRTDGHLTCPPCVGEANFLIF